jgi:hypothetical protein
MPRFKEAKQFKIDGDEFDVKDYDFNGKEKKKYTHFYTKPELE